MSIQISIDALLVIILLLNLALLSAGRLATCIRIFALQCLALSVLPLAGAGFHGQLSHALIIMLVTVTLKVLLIPWLLLRTIRSGEIQREIEPFIGFSASVLLGAGLIAASFAIASRLPLPEAMSTRLVPTALATTLIGLLVLVSRIKAITQVIGYLIVENGIFLFGLTLLHQMPLMVELGILLDVFVGVFVMAIVVYHIRREFDHMDTQLLTSLRD